MLSQSRLVRRAVSVMLQRTKHISPFKYSSSFSSVRPLNTHNQAFFSVLSKDNISASSNLNSSISSKVEEATKASNTSSTNSSLTDDSVSTSTNNTTGESKKTSFEDFWEKFTAPRPEYARWTREWYLEMMYLCVMFGVTGSAALTIVRYVMKNWLEIDASLFRGEWYNRVLYFCIMFPTYSACTMIVGTAFGRHAYSKVLVKRMWSRWGKLGRMLINLKNKV